MTVGVLFFPGVLAVPVNHCWEHLFMGANPFPRECAALGIVSQILMGVWGTYALEALYRLQYPFLDT